MARPVFSGINHIGVVTGDIERAVRTWADRYGIGPWRFYTEDSSNMRAVCDGAPTRFAFRVALAQLSPTARVDATTKLRGYFEVASVQHYLILDPEDGTVTHHKRGQGSALETRIASEGAITLDPPGLEIHLSSVFKTRP